MKNEAKFTKGPWVAGDINEDHITTISGGMYERDVCDVVFVEEKDDHNVNLIALDPEMYEELCESLETFKAIYELTQSYGAKKSIDRIESLLAKARGEK